MKRIQHRWSSKKGSALLTSVALLTMMSILVLGYLTVAVDSHSWTDQKAAEKRLKNAGESLINLAVNQIWGDFQRAQANQPNTTTWDFREYMDNMGVVDQETIDTSGDQVAAAAPDAGGVMGTLAGATAGDGVTAFQAKTQNELAQKVEDSVVSEAEKALREKGDLLKKKMQARKRGKDIRQVINLPKTVQGNDEFANVDVDGLSITRNDTFDQVRLIFEVTVSIPNTGNGDDVRGNLTKTIQEAFVIQAGEWDGMEFALLANNINCIMCHADIDNAQRVHNADPLRFGTFDRVKLGSIESMHFRSNPNSKVAGTLYLQGHALKSDGNKLTNWPDLNMKSSVFANDGHLLQDQWGKLTQSNLSPADKLDPAAMENLYLSYGESGQQPDGFMPETFPSPFPDNGGYDFSTGKVIKENAGNRVVDKSEFMATVTGSDGSISGGQISVLGPNQKITTQSQLNNFMNPTKSKVLPPITEGTVFLKGTKDNPIMLNGDIAVDGDVVISGVVKGRGAIKASGNVYMPSDVTYLDGTGVGGSRTFGVGSDGGENALAIASGGNVMVGNIFHPRWGNGTPTTGESNGSFNFIMDELALFNRMEWMKSQKTLPGKEVLVQTGTKTWTEKKFEKKKVAYQQTVNTYKWVKTGKFKQVPIYKWVTVPPKGGYGKPTKKKVISGYKKKPIKKKVKTGTKQVTKYKWVKSGTPTLIEHSEPIMEWQKPQLANPYFQGDNYIPRYYGFSKGSTIPILNKTGYLDPDAGVWVGKEHAGAWKSEYLTYLDPDNKSETMLYGAGGKAKAVVSTLTGSSWISDQLLQSMMKSELDKRDGTKDLNIDAIIYSNNSIFGIIPGRNAKGSNGKMVVNGAIVAADVGLLAPKGLKLNYDTRGNQMLKIASDNEITMKRILYAPLSL